MLEPMREVLAKTRIILASASPRRKEILENVGLKIEVLPSLVEENLDKVSYAGRPDDFVKDTAELKADDVFKSVSKSTVDSSLLVIGKVGFLHLLFLKGLMLLYSEGAKVPVRYGVYSITKYKIISWNITVKSPNFVTGA